MHAALMSDMRGPASGAGHSVLVHVGWRAVG